MDNRMNDLDKVRVMLPHWIEHNRGHGAEFLQWAERLDSESPELGDLLRRAAASLQEAHQHLDRALSRSGGALAAPGHDGHEHDHEHRHGHGHRH